MQFEAPLNQTIGILNLTNVASLVPRSSQQQIQKLAQNLTTQANAIMAAMGDVPLGTGALGLVRLDQLQRLYESSKSYMCCDVPGLAATLWTILTILGSLGLALGMACMVVLWQLDQAHGSGACCSCSSMRRKSLPAAGKAIDLEGDYLCAATTTTHRSRRYLSDHPGDFLRNFGDEPVVEVHVSGGVVAGDGVRSWLDFQSPPVQETMSSGRRH